MSTAEARIAAAPASDAPPARVPMAGERGPRIVASPEEPKPVNAHRFFFVLGYLGLVVIVVGAWAAVPGGAAEALFPIGILFVGLGGFGVLVHTLFRPNERKVRHLLLALAALALVVASVPIIRRIAREVHAAAMIARLQPLADEVVRDTRIRSVGAGANGEVSLNGAQSLTRGVGGWLTRPEPPGAVLADALARDGISRAELDAYVRGLRRTGVGEVARMEANLLFTPARMHDQRLLYVPPDGTPPRPDRPLVEGRARWRAHPLGGGWYLLLRGLDF